MSGYGAKMSCSGDLVIPAGTLLRPSEIGMITSLGRTTVHVIRKPRAAVLSTGDELVEAGMTPQPGQVINSNSYSIAAQLLESGAEPLMLGIARDERDITLKKLEEGLAADLLITTGGVSVGDRDLVKELLVELGGEIRFWKVSMKPGKPVAFAVVRGKPVFALPGNPVAAMVSFEQFVRPAILKMAGHSRIFRPVVKAVLREAVNKPRQAAAPGARHRGTDRRPLPGGQHRQPEFRPDLLPHPLQRAHGPPPRRLAWPPGTTWMSSFSTGVLRWGCWHPERFAPFASE